MEKLNLGILISGRGSNMQALIKACDQYDFPARVAIVIANRPDAAGLEIAAESGIRTAVIDHKNHEDKPSFEAAIQEELRRQNVSLVCLAGFMRLLSADFIAGWPDSIINIHPSLLPA